jgi:hypothetical protein
MTTTADSDKPMLGDYTKCNINEQTIQFRPTRIFNDDRDRLSNAGPTTYRPMTYFDERGKFVPALLGKEILTKYKFATTRDTREVYTYSDGYYQKVGESFIKREVQRALSDKTKNNFVFCSC